MTYVTCRLTAKNWDQLRNPTLGNRVWATFITSKGDGSGREERGDGKEGEGNFPKVTVSKINTDISATLGC